MPITVNHVLSSSTLKSDIFDDLFARFSAAQPDGIRFVRSVRPIQGADVYHYHRPNRECRLKPNAVVTVHHDLDDSYAWLDLKDFLPRYREAAFVVCLNSTQAARLDGLGLHNLTMIPHGADHTVLTPTPLRACENGPPVTLGFVSTRHQRGVKGEDRLWSLMELLNTSHFAFTFIGPGRWRDAQEARRLGFKASHFERLPYRLMGRAYGEIDALLMLSHFEGGPANVPEALAAGRPVLATSVGMVPDFVKDGDNGLVLCGDMGVDAPRIAELADMKNGMLAKYAEGARSTEVPSWNWVVERYVTLYRNIAHGRRAT